MQLYTHKYYKGMFYLHVLFWHESGDYLHLYILCYKNYTDISFAVYVATEYVHPKYFV